MQLTSNEKLILDAMWKAREPLTRSGIIDLILESNPEFKENSFYKYLNELLDKDLINEGEIVRTGKSFGRTYITNISKDEYYMMKLHETKEQLDINEETNVSFIFNLIDSSNFDLKDIEELEELLEKKKLEVEINK